MENDTDHDLISELPQSIIETILTKLPIRDAVRTSIFSSRWRYKWASLTHLVFDDQVATHYNGQTLVREKIVNFITRCLFLHEGPIHKFSLCSSYFPSLPDIDQWLLFVSRKGLKELILKLGEDEWFRAPSSVFSFEKLCRLELVRCELDPPPNFSGFSFLKCLILQQVLIPPDDIECLISSCPLLESLTLSYFDSLELTVRAPNLKYLVLEGEFKDLRLVSTPLLVDIAVVLYMANDIAEHFEQRSSCNFDNLLGGVPKLERLIGHIDFTKCSSNTSAAMQAPDLQYWDAQSSIGSTFHRLKNVKLTDVSGVLHEMKFIEFLLDRSPFLEELSITPTLYATGGRLTMLVDLVGFRRASPRASINFIHEPV